jgi:hypothetical protein
MVASGVAEQGSTILWCKLFRNGGPVKNGVRLTAENDPNWAFDFHPLPDADVLALGYCPPGTSTQDVAAFSVDLSSGLFLKANVNILHPKQDNMALDKRLFVPFGASNPNANLTERSLTIVMGGQVIVGPQILTDNANGRWAIRFVNVPANNNSTLKVGIQGMPLPATRTGLRF